MSDDAKDEVEVRLKLIETLPNSYKVTDGSKYRFTKTDGTEFEGERWIWLPKSKTRAYEDTGEGTTRFRIPKWLAVKNDIEWEK